MEEEERSIREVGVYEWFEALNWIHFINTIFRLSHNSVCSSSDKMREFRTRKSVQCPLICILCFFSVLFIPFHNDIPFTIPLSFLSITLLFYFLLHPFSLLDSSDSFSFIFHFPSVLFSSIFFCFLFLSSSIFFLSSPSSFIAPNLVILTHSDGVSSSEA